MSIGIALLVSTYAARALFPMLSAQLQVWRGYYVIRTDTVDETGDIGASYDPATRSRLVSPGTTLVWVSLIDRLEAIPLAEADKRLVEADPRRDPYIDSLHGYFSAAGRTVAYYRSSAPPWLVYHRFARFGTIPSGSIDLLGWCFWLTIMRAGVVAAVLLFVPPGPKRGDQIVPLGGLVLLPLAAQGGTWGLVAGICGAVAWIVVAPGLLDRVEHYSSRLKRRRPVTVREIIASGLSITVVLVALPLHPRPLAALYSFLLTIPGFFAVLLVSVSLKMRSSTKWEHPVFRPVPLVFAPRLSELSLRVGCVLAISLLLFGSVDRAFSMSNLAGVARPDRVEGVGNNTWGDLERLSSFERPGDLPDLSSYLAHAAFQEWLHVGREYRFPSRGERIEISTFREEELRIVRDTRLLAVLDDDWFERVLTDGEVSGIIGMLLSQPTPVAVRREPTPGFRESAVDFAVIALSALILFFVARPRARLFGDLDRPFRGAGRTTIS